MNRKTQKSIAGIGSALIDVLIRLEDDQLLDFFGLSKGSMTLVDSNLSKIILESTTGLKRTIETGGSSANTIRAIGQLKGAAGFIGKICDDDMGRFFQTEFGRLKIRTHLLYGDIPTGVAAALISTNSERTFATYLGAASELLADELSSEIFERYDYLHIEGYLVFNHKLIEGVLKLAKSCELKVSLDMASYNVVEANLDFLKYLVASYVDIVFANEEEAKAYTGLDPEDAVCEIARQCEIAVVKTGRKGSLVRSGDTFLQIATPQVESIDTTGAGDVYASGFLYGLANGFSLGNCGKLGSLMASKVIQVPGAKIPDESWSEILQEAERLRGNV